MGKPLSQTTMAIEFKRRIRILIKKMFNKEIFGTYEGIIETIDEANASIEVSIPELGEVKVKGCRVMTPCLAQDAYIIPVYNVGDHVVLMFTAFSLKNPIIIGQVREIGTEYNLSKDNMTLKNGESSISMTPDGSISISGTSIILSGESIITQGSWGSDDLTNDDVGIM